MSQIINKMQFHVKKSSSDMFTYILRVLTGGWIGLVFAFTLQTIFGFGSFLFFFVIVLFTGAIVRMSRGWGMISVIIFNLFCVLIGVLLRMYIMIAPGA